MIESKRVPARSCTPFPNLLPLCLPGHIIILFYTCSCYLLQVEGVPTRSSYKISLDFFKASGTGLSERSTKSRRLWRCRVSGCLLGKVNWRTSTKSERSTLGFTSKSAQKLAHLTRCPVMSCHVLSHFDCSVYGPQMIASKTCLCNPKTDAEKHWLSLRQTLLIGVTFLMAQCRKTAKYQWK